MFSFGAVVCCYVRSCVSAPSFKSCCVLGDWIVVYCVALSLLLFVLLFVLMYGLLLLLCL